MTLHATRPAWIHPPLMDHPSHPTSPYVSASFHASHSCPTTHFIRCLLASETEVSRSSTSLSPRVTTPDSWALAVTTARAWAAGPCLARRSVSFCGAGKTPQGGELGGSEYSLRFDSLRTICREIQVCSPSVYDIRMLCNYCVLPANVAQPSMQGLEAKKCEKHELIS
jgi:hypothetical protein